MSRYGGGYSPPRGPERWDRDRFEAHSRAPPVVERDRYEEVDYYSRSPRRDQSADFRRRSPPRFQEKDRYYFQEKERFGASMPYRPKGPGRYYDEEGDTLEQAMVPVRDSHGDRDREIEIDFRSRERREPPPPPRFTRPQFVRRQSSLDTFDRKPMPRYGDRVREEVITIPSGPRRRSPPRYVEQEIEEIRVAEPEFYGDEEFRGYREREISRVRRNRPEEVIEEKEEIIEKVGPKRGKTKMPGRLVNKRAIIELGYPFEEEGETVIILQALGKEHIDEVIKISREYNAAPAQLPAPPPAPPEETRTTYIIEKPPSPAPPAEEKVIERRTEIIRDAPEIPRSVREWDALSLAPPSHRSPSPQPSRKSHHTSHSHSRSHHTSRARSVSSASTRRELIITEDRGEESSVRGGVGALGALIVPNHGRRSSRSIKYEIEALKAERRALEQERKGDKLRGHSPGGEVIIERGKDEVVEVRKDKKGRLMLRR